MASDKRVKVTLACEDCKRRNYITMKNKMNDRERIEMKKYCRFDRRHTLHKETASASRPPAGSRDVTSAAPSAGRIPATSTGAPMVDQAELIAAAQAGDRSAFDELVRQTYVDTYTLAVRLTRDEEDARDVVQDAYLRAWKGIGGFRGDAQFSTWLYRITANCAVDARAPPPPAPHRAARRPPRARRPARRVPARGDGRVDAELDRVAAARRRAPAQAAGGRGAEGRLRAAPRGDRRGARDLGLGGEGPAPPGPATPARRARTRRRGRPVRYEDVADLLPGLVDGTVDVDERDAARSSSPTCAARPSWPGTAGCSARSSRSGPRYLEPAPGPARRDAHRARRAEGERRVVRSIITGRRLAYAGAALGGAAVAGAAAAAVIAPAPAAASRRLRPPGRRSTAESRPGAACG